MIWMLLQVTNQQRLWEGCVQLCHGLGNDALTSFTLSIDLNHNLTSPELWPSYNHTQHTSVVISGWNLLVPLNQKWDGKAGTYLWVWLMVQGWNVSSRIDSFSYVQCMKKAADSQYTAHLVLRWDVSSFLPGLFPLQLSLGHRQQRTGEEATFREPLVLHLKPIYYHAASWYIYTVTRQVH